MQEIDAKPRLGHSLHENFQTACYVGHLNGSWFRLETCQVQSFRNEITFCLDALFLHTFLRFSEKLEKKNQKHLTFLYLFTESVDRLTGIFQSFLRSELDGIEYAVYIVLCVKYNEIERKTGTPGRKETEAPQEIDARKNCKPDAALSLC